MKSSRTIAFFVIVFLCGAFAVSSTLNFFSSGDSGLVVSNYMPFGLGSGSQLHHPPPALRSACARLSLDSRQSKVPSFAGSPAILVYGCKREGPAFFTTDSRSDFTRSVIPAFSLPSGWTLSVGVARSHGDCLSRDKITTLSNGIPVKLRTDTEYVYCLTATSASTFASFSVTWNE